MARPRSRFASFLAVLGALCAAFGLVGLWASRTLGDADAFSSLADGMLGQRAVVSRLAVVIVDRALETAPPEVRQQRRLIVSTTESVLEDERFVPVFEDVLRDAHGQLIDGRGDVRLELAPALDAVAVQVRLLAPAVADQLDAVEPPVPTILARSQADRVRGVIDFERAASIGLLIGAIVFVAIAAIGGGPRAFVPFGVTLAIACVALLVLMLGLDALVDVEVSSASGDAASSAFGVVIGGLRTTLILAALAGIATAVVASVATRRT